MLDSSVTNPPFLHHYGTFFHNTPKASSSNGSSSPRGVIGECDLPIIDLSMLRSAIEGDRKACIEAIAKASSEWGFFQVLNHGVSQQLLMEMRREQVKVFELPFEKKVSCGILNDSYRWGNPLATSLEQFLWSEAFHVPLNKISEEGCVPLEFNSLREAMEKLAEEMSKLAWTLAGVLAGNLGHARQSFTENCDGSTCFLRLNRYPPCPFLPEIFGLMPHTDSDFLTILYQDQVGGLQLMKDSKWVAVKPNPDALIVNIGDLFQAWSNDVYKSVKHKVVTNESVERYSIAYFMCPSYDSLIGSCRETSLYKQFTFGEFRRQVQEDVKKTGQKIGLPKFLL